MKWYYIDKANASQPHTLPSRTSKRKIQAWQRVCLSNRTDEKAKYDCPTMAIRNAGFSANLKIGTLNKLTAKRKVKCLEIPHYS